MRILRQLFLAVGSIIIGVLLAAMLDMCADEEAAHEHERSPMVNAATPAVLAAGLAVAVRIGLGLAIKAISMLRARRAAA